MKRLPLCLLAAILALALGGAATAMAQEKPSLWSSQPNVLQGQGLEAGTVWVLGEIRNDGSSPAYDVAVTARLVDESQAVVDISNQVVPYLGPGDTVAYRIEMKPSSGYARAEVSVEAAGSWYWGFTRLPIAWVNNEKVTSGRDQMRYQFSGTLANDTRQQVALSAIYVWFLDDQGRVVWMENCYAPSALAPGDSYGFSVRTARDSENPAVAGITQLRYYAFGRLP